MTRPRHPAGCSTTSKRRAKHSPATADGGDFRHWIEHSDGHPLKPAATWDDLFLLGDPVERRAARVVSLGLSREDAVALALDSEVRGTMVAAVVSGTQLRDFLWPGSVFPRLVRTRVIDLLVSEDLTGWFTYEVDLLGRDEEPIEGYVGFGVSARCGPFQPGGVPPRWRFDLDTWDGSDFFTPHNTRVIFLTSRARNALVTANVRNIRLERLSEAKAPPDYASA